MITSGSPPISARAIQRAAVEFQLTLNEQQVQQIQQYTKILLTWNDKVNLTAIRDPLEILYRHFCESMFGTSLLPVENCRLADVGTGGGFPGLPMKIMCPDLDLYLVESNVRKATFLAEVVRELGLTGARVLISRYEELGEEVAPLDIVCSRSLGDFANFLGWAASPQVSLKQALLLLGGRDLGVVRAVPGWTWSDPELVRSSISFRRRPN